MKTVVATANAPKAIGPYSQGIIHEGLLYCSGQIPLDPATGSMVEGGVAEQTERVLENLKGVLEAAGSTIGLVLKTTVYLVDMDEFAAMNAVYERYFKEHPPARATVEVSRLPRNARVEIDCIGVVRPL